MGVCHHCRFLQIYAKNVLFGACLASDFAVDDRERVQRQCPIAVAATDKIPLTGVGKNDHCTLEKKYKYFDYEVF